MSVLDTIFPTEEVLAAVPELRVRQLGIRDIKDIVRFKSKAMFEMGLSTWHAALMSGSFNLDPRMLSKHVDCGDPHLLKHVSRALNRKVIFDLNYTFGEIPSQALREPAVQTTIAHLFPNRIHIADAKLLDPRKPLPGTEDDDDRSHESLHLFSIFVANCRAAAAEIAAEKITFTAAYAELVDPFRKHGFEVEESDFGRMALEFGMGIPMEMRL